jgi:hypothetical protein
MIVVLMILIAAITGAWVGWAIAVEWEKHR